jgi:hypothetical protein
MRPWFRAARVVAGVVLLILAWFTGATRVTLIAGGERATGQIVGYEQARINSRGAANTTRSSTTFLPVVEFSAAGQTVRFTDWLGSPSRGGIRDSVRVLYDPAQPSVAVIDRPVGNWLPWAPFAATGGLLLLASLRNRN